MPVARQKKGLLVPFLIASNLLFAAGLAAVSTFFVLYVVQNRTEDTRGVNAQRAEVLSQEKAQGDTAPKEKRGGDLPERPDQNDAAKSAKEKQPQEEKRPSEEKKPPEKKSPQDASEDKPPQEKEKPAERRNPQETPQEKDKDPKEKPKDEPAKEKPAPKAPHEKPEKEKPEKKAPKPLTQGSRVTIQGRCYIDPEESPTRPPYLVVTVITKRGSDPSAKHNLGIAMDNALSFFSETPIPPPPSGKGEEDVSSAVCMVPLSRLPLDRIKVLRSIKKNSVITLRGKFIKGFPTVLLDECELVALAPDQDNFPPLPKEIKSDAGQSSEAPTIDEATRKKLAALVTSLRDGKAEERMEALHSLAKMGANAKPALRAVCEAVLEKTADIREAAIDALTSIDPDLAKPVLTLLTNKDVSENTAASQTIARMTTQGTAAIPILLWHMDFAAKRRDADSMVPWDIAALAAVGPNDPQAVRAIIALANKELPVPKSERNLTFRWLTTHAIRFQAIQALGTLASQVRGTNRDVAIGCLVKVAGEIQGFKEAMNVPGRGDLKVKLTNFCLATMSALAEYGPEAKEAIPLLKPLRTFPEATIREAAIAALAKIGAAPAEKEKN